MEVPYESTGRRRQKCRTRAALVSAAHELLARGAAPTVEDAAAEAGISRTTAYRYFPNQRALLLAAYPEIDAGAGLLPPDAPTDLAARLDLVMREFIGFTVRWEPQLRTQLRLSLEPGAEQPVLRGGRAIRWIEEALEPLAETHPEVDVHGLAVAIRSATGIESLVWLTDIGGLDRERAAEVLAASARAIFRAALGPAA
ncbi:DNA-binding transcriptional regulator, AcrR family [Amycolatopsis pretoriensis]|uniref:DNA-binding transcriptional regulator, AcrR family n=1 Tax=Amycolatopsis pretoriensis TaxID=218821 RepID=A0A1H5Q7Z3_9PSEU|nr:TetR/AcrR family transcriptional regulator [Amycolatopsis pretoriensis]SEF21377.1 DNA-binding transcriptional regulator, AcrR family [Amycolatopsis pretoriensis]